MMNFNIFWSYGLIKIKVMKKYISNSRKLLIAKWKITLISCITLSNSLYKKECYGKNYRKQKPVRLAQCLLKKLVPRKKRLRTPYQSRANFIWSTTCLWKVTVLNKFLRRKLHAFNDCFNDTAFFSICKKNGTLLFVNKL